MSDVTANRHGGNPFSEAAHASLTDKAKIRAAILAFIASRGELGATSDEAEEALGISHQSCSARFTELKALELVTPAGRRPTRSGRSAGVYIAAACAGINDATMHPDTDAQADAAKTICRPCTVRHHCLTYAYATDDRHGVLGGLTAEERRVLRQPRSAS